MSDALRLERRAVGALYGALAIVVASTAVVGIAIAAAPHPHDGARSLSEGKLADLFLEAILSSSEGDGLTSVREAVANLCLAKPCPHGSQPRESLPQNVSVLAGPLADGLGRQWSCSLSNTTSLVWAVGDLPEDSPATASRFDIFHGPSGGYLTVTLRLSRL